MVLSGSNTCDHILGGRVTVVQPRSGYRVGIEPILLAAAVEANPGETVLDLGSGVGAVSLCLGHRIAGLRQVALEQDHELVRCAEINKGLNGLDLRVVVGDLRSPPSGLVEVGGFDWVVINPPFLRLDRHTPSPVRRWHRTHCEGHGTLADWLKTATRLLRPRGYLLLVHRSERLDELLYLLRPRFGEVIIYPLWSKRGREAGRIIVRARRDVASDCRLLAGMTLHQSDGSFTAEAEHILREAGGLSLTGSPRPLRDS